MSSLLTRTRRILGFNQSQDRSSVIKRHISLSLVYKGLNIFTSLALVSVSLQYLGVELYGVWSTLISLLAWSKLFDVGIGNGLRNKLTEALAQDNQELAKSYVSTAYVSLNILSFLALLVLGIGGALVNWAELLNVHTMTPRTLYLTFLITLIFTILNFSTGLISSVCAALQQSSLLVLNQWLSNFFALLLLLSINLLPYKSIILLAVVYGSALVLPNFLISFQVFRRHRALIPSLAAFEKFIVRDILSLGFKFFIIQIAVLIYSTTDKLVITHFLGPQYVTEYDLVCRLFVLPGIITGTINSSLWSGYTDAYNRGDKEWIKKIISKLVASIPVYSCLTFFLILVAEPIIYVWSSQKINVSFLLVVLFSINAVMSYCISIFNNVLTGIEKINLATFIAIIGAIVNLFLSITLARFLGLSGVVIGTIVASIAPIIFFPMQVFYWIYMDSSNQRNRLISIILS